MNMISTTRTAMGVSQSKFGRFLADAVGRDSPFPASRVSEWEHGRSTPNRRVREACRWVAAHDAACEIREIDHRDPGYYSKVERLIVDSQS